AARPPRPHLRGGQRRAGASRRSAGPHLQPRSRDSADDAARARAGAGAIRSPKDTKIDSNVQLASCNLELATMIGVLLMAHGTPSTLDEMPEYLRLVRGGRPPSDELVAEMRHNYAAIGGRSPLTDITLAQANALRQRLGPDIHVAVGMRTWSPFITDA